MKIAIIGGTGGMGKTLIRFFKKENIAAKAVGRKTKAPLKTLAQADIIFISLPSEYIQFAVSLLDQIDTSKKLIVSLGSIMTRDQKELKSIMTPTLHMHQLFGPKTYPFSGQKIICAGDVSHAYSNFLKKLFIKNKVIIETMTAKRHDDLMARTQVLSQFGTIVLGSVLSQSGHSKKKLLDASTITFRMNADTIRRIAAQKATLWSFIQFENPDAAKALDLYVKNALEFRKFAKNKDKKGFEKAFDKMASFWNN